MGFHISNEPLLATIPSKSMRLESITDASEIISHYLNEDFNNVNKKVLAQFLNKIDIYKPLFIHFMSEK